MNSRERVQAALEHRTSDRPPIDLGATSVTGAHVSVVSRLRRALGLDREGARVKVVEPFQMLGEIGEDLRAALGVDCVGLGMSRNFFGFENRDWKPWVTFDGTPVLTPGLFNTVLEANGDLLQYPEGDKSAPASGRMPSGGFYFDAIVRQPPLDEATLRVEDNLEEFGLVPEEELERLRLASEELWRNTPYAVVGSFGGSSFGDVALVPAPWMKRPRGIRDVAEWYMSLITRPGHVRAIFEGQCETALRNLELLHQAVGERISVFFSSGTDFGAQNAPFISPDAYRELFAPFHRRVNDWVHRHTAWKTFMHSCGSVEKLIPEFIAAGFDILNPVQCSAAGMAPERLKALYGERLCFWGGLVNTQRTLPFGTAREAEDEARERLRIFAQRGGYVANPIHNIQAGCPVENVIGVFRAAREFRCG